MKQIEIGFTKKSIDNAIKAIREYQKQVEEIVPTFLHRCSERIIKMANAELEDRAAAFGLHSDIVNAIKGGWVIGEVKNTSTLATITITNEYEKATYIEFGVGLVGKINSHDKAEEVGYGYDLKNHREKGWSFKLIDPELDIGDKYITREWTTSHDQRIIYTQGQPAAMFLHNAVLDFKEKKEFLPIIEELLKGLE